MLKKVSHALTTMAAISIAILPVTAMETNSPESLTLLHTPTTTNNPIKESIEPNYKRCIYIIWARVEWCVTW